MCFDFGLKRIGIATGNTLTKTAQSLKTIPAKKGVPNWNMVNALVSGSEGKSAMAARKFGEKLTLYTGISVQFVDERLTSVAADELLRESSMGRSITRKRQESRDSLAAELILQTHFEEKQKE